MVKRAVPGLLLAGSAALGVAGGRVAMLFVVMVVALFAADEVYRLIRASGVLPASGAGFASIMAFGIIGYERGARAPALFPFVVAAALFLSFVTVLSRRDRENVTRTLAYTMLPVVTLGLPITYVIALRIGGFRLAWGYVLSVLLAEAGAATATWFVRRRALTPRARRTKEHLVGSVCGALIASVVLAEAISPPFTWARALLLGVIVAAVLTAGDLAWATIRDDLPLTEPGANRPLTFVAPWIGGAVLVAPAFFYVFRAFVS